MDVLVVRAGALGDVLLLRRAIAALRRADHRAHLFAPSVVGGVLVGPGPGEASRLTPLDGPGAAAWLAAELAGGGLADSLRSDAVLALTRSIDIIARLRTLAPRVLERDPSPPPGTHASRWLADPLRALGVDPTPDPPVIAFTTAERDEAREIRDRLPGGFLAVHPGSGSAAKNWSADRFAALVRAHADQHRWLLVSGPADAESAASLADLPGALPARGLPLRVLGALLAHAGLYVGNDSGVTHLAAATGAPTLALFGPTDAARWGPVGPLVATVSSPDGSMQSLDLETALEAAGRLLERSRSSAERESPK